MLIPWIVLLLPCIRNISAAVRFVVLVPQFRSAAAAAAVPYTAAGMSILVDD